MFLSWLMVDYSLLEIFFFSTVSLPFQSPTPNSLFRYRTAPIPQRPPLRVSLQSSSAPPTTVYPLRGCVTVGPTVKEDKTRRIAPRKFAPSLSSDAGVESVFPSTSAATGLRIAGIGAMKWTAVSDFAAPYILWWYWKHYDISNWITLEW